MNYDLAKQLKDAGFPDSHLWGQTTYEDMGVVKITFLKPPTLSELIEAVRENKDHYFSLDYNDAWSVYEEPVENRWRARYYPNTPVGFCEQDGKTPEEAVAKLWLELNEND